MEDLAFRKGTSTEFANAMFNSTLHPGNFYLVPEKHQMWYANTSSDAFLINDSVSQLEINASSGYASSGYGQIGHSSTTDNNIITQSFSIPGTAADKKTGYALAWSQKENDLTLTKYTNGTAGAAKKILFEGDVPSKTGAGASGTWNININGNAKGLGYTSWNGDLNAMLSAGVYWINLSACTGTKPRLDSTQGYGYLEIVGKQQTFTYYHNGISATRTYINNKWSPWALVMTLNYSENYYGLQGPAGPDSYLRMPKNGILPYASASQGVGIGHIGTNSFWFGEIYVDDLHTANYGAGAPSSKHTLTNGCLYFKII